MSDVQAIILGAIVALTPSLLALAFPVWRAPVDEDEAWYRTSSRDRIPHADRGRNEAVNRRNVRVGLE
jgi:hypothetical protein